MSRKAKIAIGVVVVIAIAGVVAVSVKRKDRGLKEVTTGIVEKADLVSKVSANGRIEANRKVEISANVMGQIVNLAVRGWLSVIQCRGSTLRSIHEWLPR